MVCVALSAVVSLVDAQPAAASLSAYQAAVGQDSPLLWYQLDDPAGTAGAGSVVNSGAAGSAWNGTPGGGVGFGGASAAGGVAGQVNAAGSAVFNGTTGVVSIPAPGGSIPTITSFSVEAWFHAAPSFSGKGYVATLLGTTSGIGLNGGKAFATVNESSQSYTITSAPTYNNSRWHYLVLTDSAGQLTLYVDGSNVASTTTTGALVFSSTTQGAIGDNSGVPGSFFAGSVEDVAAYATALVPARILAHYNAAFSLAGGPITAQDLGSSGPCAAPQTPNPKSHDPVDLANGALTETALDLQTPGRGLPLSFLRSYTSAFAGVAGPLGKGWTDPYNMALSFGSGSPPSTVSVSGPNGSVVVFDQSGSGYAPAEPRDQATLTENASGPAWTYTCRAKSVYDFNAAGQLVDEHDLDGNTTTIGPVSGGAQTLTDPAGRAWTLTYIGGLVTGLAEQTGGSLPARSVSFGFTGGLLTSVHDVNGGVTNYGYDAAGRLAVVRTARFAGDGPLPAAPTSCSGAAPLDATGVVYDSGGRVLCQWDPLGRETVFGYLLDGSGNITQTTVTDPKSDVTVYTFAQGLPITMTKGAGGTASTWTYGYDPAEAGVTSTVDPDGHTSYQQYDANGNLVASTDGLGRTTTMVYDNLDDLLSVTDADKVTTTNTYDADGNLQTSSTPLLDSAGHPVMNGANPVLDNTTYDHTDGHPEDVTSMIDADGNTWSYTYDPTRGYLLSATAPPTSDNTEHPGVAQSNETLYGYDTVKGWPTATLSPRGQQATGASPSVGLSCTPPAVGCTTYSYADSTKPSGYDLFGHATVTTNPDGDTTTTLYDADENLVSTTDGNGSTTRTAYDAAEEATVVTQADLTTTRTDYNRDGTTADTVDANGAETTYGYDNQGRLTSMTTPPSATNPAGDTTSYGYLRHEGAHV